MVGFGLLGTRTLMCSPSGVRLHVKSALKSLTTMGVGLLIMQVDPKPPQFSTPLFGTFTA